MPTDLLNARLPQTFNSLKKKAISVKHNKAKCNKERRYACTYCKTVKIATWEFERGHITSKTLEEKRLKKKNVSANLHLY